MSLVATSEQRAYARGFEDGLASNSETVERLRGKVAKAKDFAAEFEARDSDICDCLQHTLGRRLREVLEA